MLLIGNKSVKLDIDIAGRILSIPKLKPNEYAENTIDENKNNFSKNVIINSFINKLLSISGFENSFYIF